MGNSDIPASGSWDKIQTGVHDTERLIGQKKYNMAMVKARQTLEYMVKCLCGRAGITEGSLIDMIDALYEEGMISRTTCEHYHKIRTIGNKAIHEEDNNAYNANQAHHLLSQEVYTFANDYSPRKRKTAQTPRRQETETARRPRSSGSSSASSASRRRRAHASGPSLDPGSLIKPLLLIAIIIVLIFIIKMIHPGREEAPETTAPAISTEAPTEAPTEPPTEEPPTEAAPTMYKTTDTLNVRSTPSTNDARIGVLAAGTEVEFVRDYDDRWCVILFRGQEAYVSKEYLTPVE